MSRESPWIEERPERPLLRRSFRVEQSPWSEEDRRGRTREGDGDAQDEQGGDRSGTGRVARFGEPRFWF